MIRYRCKGCHKEYPTYAEAEFHAVEVHVWGPYLRSCREATTRPAPNLVPRYSPKSLYQAAADPQGWGPYN